MKLRDGLVLKLDKDYLPVSIEEMNECHTLYKREVVIEEDMDVIPKIFSLSGEKRKNIKTLQKMSLKKEDVFAYELIIHVDVT
ncbi:MAG: hypothetical protein LBG59_02435 [Candidatus Peribacteria bacterium]|jgi:hypothetical protein|nr:hypothetical protein [Candidatus Peribacteria bacterium]